MEAHWQRIRNSNSIRSPTLSRLPQSFNQIAISDHTPSSFHIQRKSFIFLYICNTKFILKVLYAKPRTVFTLLIACHEITYSPCIQDKSNDLETSPDSLEDLKYVLRTITDIKDMSLNVENCMLTIAEKYRILETYHIAVRISFQSHFNLISISFQSHFNLISISFQSHFNLISISFQSHFNLISISFQSHFNLISISFNLISISFQSHFNLISISFQSHFNLISISFQSHFNLIQSHFNLISISFQSHFNLISISFQSHFNLISISFQSHFNLISISFQYHFNLISISFQSIIYSYLIPTF